MFVEQTGLSMILVVIGIAAIIVEIIVGAATGFDLFLLGLIFIGGGLVGRVAQSNLYAFAVIFILSVFYIAIGRRLVQSRLSFTGQKSGTDNLVGKKARVIKKIQTGKAGQVKIEGEIWRAAADNNIDVGRTVVIQSVSGVTLKVKA